MANRLLAHLLCTNGIFYGFRIYLSLIVLVAALFFCASAFSIVWKTVVQSRILILKHVVKIEFTFYRKYRELAGKTHYLRIVLVN